MSDPLLTRTMRAICDTHCPPEVVRAAENGRAASTLWDTLAEAGLPWAGIGEAAGGCGGTAADAAEVVRIAAAAAAPVPLAETALIGAPLLAEAGLPLPPGPLAIAPNADELTLTDGFVLRGTARSVCWARSADHLVAVAGSSLVCIPTAGLRIEPGRNHAGEPRDTVVVPDVAVPRDAVAPVEADALWRRGAYARAVQIAGAVERVLDLTVGFARGREQFGRPIARFQAVGHLVTRLAEQVAQARMAAESAAGLGVVEVATAKIIAGGSATRAAALAHQIHGAIGMTEEYDLQLFTRRLWSWRDEFGSEGEWADLLGAEVAGRSDDLWGLISG